MTDDIREIESRERIHADLRTKMKALPHDDRCDTQGYLSSRGHVICTCWKRDVLALLGSGGG